MKLGADEVRPVAEALQALASGDSCAFCDIMWLGLGDRWMDVLRDLERGKYVVVMDPESSEGVRITDRGRAAAVRLGQSGRRTA